MCWLVHLQPIIRKSFSIEAGYTLNLLVHEMKKLKIEDLAGIDAGKISIEKAFEIIDKIRSEDRH
jgi:hypothetical protein